MKTYAITGGIGSGKSTIKQWFEKQHVPTLDADQIARELVEPGQPALTEIAKTFGQHIILKNGQLNREAMREQVFANENSRKKLEAILHPLIRETTAKKLASLESKKHKFAVVEIPLLVETGKPDYIDEVILADCSPSQQIQRVQQRNHWSFEAIAKVMKQQASRQERLCHADIIIDTSGSLSSVEAQLQQHFAGLLP